MNYANKLTNFRIKLLLIGLISLGALLLMQASASALSAPIPSNTLPESSDFSQGNHVWLTTANADGTNFLLTSLTSVVRIYSSDPGGVDLTITNGGHCPGNGPDQGATESEVTTQFEFHTLDSPPGSAAAWNTAPYTDLGPGSAARTYLSSELGCGNKTIHLSHGATAATEPGYAQSGKFAYEIRAIWKGGAPGWNQFKYSLPLGQGRFSYFAGSGDHFALKAANDACSPYVYPGCTGEFRMGFAPNCALKSNTTGRIKWFDADAGQANQGGEQYVKTVVFEYDTAGNRTGAQIVGIDPGKAEDHGAGQLWITSGNSTSGYADITIRPNHKYEWRWFGIHTANGIQFQLPTDSYNTLIDFSTDCNPGGGGTAAESDAACVSISTNKPSYTVGDSPIVTVVVKNVGTVPWNSKYLLRQISPPGADKPVSGTIGLGKNASFTFTLAPRGSPTTINFQYQMVDDNGKLFTPPTPNPLCQTSITWSSAGAQPSVSAGCGSTSVTIPSASILATRAGVKIGVVPVALVITESGTSNSYTYVIPGGVNLATGGTWTTSAASGGTFGMWSGMWLHKSYDIKIAVQGTQAQNSLIYNNDGTWFQPGGNMASGPYWYGINTFNTDTVSNCMDADCHEGQTSVPDSEPGQAKRISYGIKIYNRSQRVFSDNDGAGYHFTAASDGGIDPSTISGLTASPDIVPGDPATINVSFDARIDWRGHFWISMYFQGGLLVLPLSDFGFDGNCPHVETTPNSRPYFEVRAGDLSTGGGFGRPSDGACSIAAPGYINPATAGYDYAGGIRAYGVPNDSRGSEAEFGAYSLGLVLGYPDGGPDKIGFFSGHAQLLANSGVPNAPTGGNLGGYLNPASASAAHCVNDFFTKTRLTNTAPANFPGNTISGLPSGQYEHTGDLDLTASTIAPGQRVTLYVTGTVTIHNDIKYAPTWDPTVRDNVPYFALIVKGNIVLTSGVGRIDGLYVAQPNSVYTGIFSTCDSFCPNQLIVNGGVIAQQVSLNRAHGTVGPLDADLNGLTDQPAEIFRYMPSMIIGEPYFEANDNVLESIFNLPPVF